jgi:hypothetical protein
MIVLIFNELMMYRFSWSLIALAHWKQQESDVATLWHIILILSQPVFALSL